MGQITVDKNGSVLQGGEPFEFDDARLAEERRWARGHAETWGEKEGLEEEILEEFCNYFAQGWLEYIEDSSADVDAGMKSLYKTFLKERKESDNG